MELLLIVKVISKHDNFSTDSMQTMKQASHLMCCLYIFGLLLTTKVFAQDGFEKLREFEELRLRQLKTVQSNSKIKAFITDGCSGFQSKNWAIFADTLPGFEKWFGSKPPWESCCIAHDEIYWRGEVANGYVKRQEADEILKQCIIDTGTKMAPQLSLKFSLSEDRVNKAFSATANMMHKAVRLGGLPCSLLPWRWGYGWENCAFSAISEAADNLTEPGK